MNSPPTTSQPNPTVRWLARASWVVVALAYLTFFFLDLRQDYAQMLVPCEGVCNYFALSQAEMDALEAWGWTAHTYAAIMVGATMLGVGIPGLLGGLLLWRQGNTRIGWMVSLALVAMPITMITDVDNVIANYPGMLIPSGFLSALGTLIIFLFLYLFPNGRFYPRGAFVFCIVSFVFFVVLIWESNGQIPLPVWIEAIGEWVVISLLFLALGFQILRYQRASTALERQQTKWVMLGIFLLVINFPIWFLVFGGVVTVPAGQPRLLASLGGWLTNNFLIATLPITMAIAISRYRLWEIDLVVRRTLQYGLLTGLLALIYFGGVITLQAGFRALTGQITSPLITVLSTLAIAALFNPLRHRVQDFIDRRFYRKKYNAEQALARFSAVARDEVDMDILTTALSGVVNETVQPESVSIWLKGDR